MASTTGGADTVHHHINNGGGGEHFISQWVHKLAKVRYQVVLAGQVAIQEIRKAGHSKQNARYQGIRCVEPGRAHVAHGSKYHKERHHMTRIIVNLLGRFMVYSSTLLSA